MAEEIRVNRNSNGDQDVSYSRNRSGSMVPWIILAVLVVVIGVVGFMFRDKLFTNKSATDKQTSSGYQAVFLTNGQVYFGKLANASSDYVTLTDIYYLQVTQPALQGSQQNGGSTAATQQQVATPESQPQLSLVKLGNELHGPLDSMKINREQILFYEDMKADAKVIEAINKYKADPTSGQQAPAQAPAQQTPAPAGTQLGQ